MNTFGSLLYKVIFPLSFAISLALFFYFLQAGKVKATLWSGFFVFLFIALTVTLFLQDRLLSEPKTSGVLIPANEPTPDNPCNNIPSNAIVLLFGNSAAYTTKFPHTVIQVGKQNLLTIDKQGEKITISAKFFSKDGRIIAELEKNKFYINPNNYFRKDRPDKHSLIVYDQQGQQVLNVKYLNKSTIKLVGIFYFPNRPPIIIREDAQIFGGITMSRMCFGENKVDIHLE